MTIEPSYTENELRRVGAAIHLSGYLDRVIRRSTPDTRLQDMVNAWNEGIYGKKFVRRDNPELAALLDAFAKETDDDT